MNNRSNNNMRVSKTPVTVPKTVKSKTVTTHIDYTTHPKYMTVSCDTKLVNVGKDVTLMMLDDSINDKGHIINEPLFISKLETMVKRGKRPPSSTKGGKEDYTDDMTTMETKVNQQIKGKTLLNKKGEEVQGMFYFRNLTKLKKNKKDKK
jgi:hypothetical protein